MQRDNKTIIFTAVLFVWAGMILAISFVEAPLKFTAPNVTLVIGVGIGRLVFSALNKFEILYTLISWFLIYQLKKTKVIIPIIIISIIILIQTAILLPVLDARAMALIENKPVPGESPHIYYVALEVTKFILLITAGTIAAKELTIQRDE